MLLRDAFPVLFTQVRQGDEVPEQKGVAVVIILQVQCATKTGGQPFEKAEGAIIATGPQAVKEAVGEFHTQVLIRVLLHDVGARVAVVVNDRLYLLVGLIETIINDVTQQVAVQRDEAVSGLPGQVGGDALGANGGDNAAWRRGWRVGHGGIVHAAAGEVKVPRTFRTRPAVIGPSDCPSKCRS